MSALHAPSQLLLRQQQLLPEGPLLVINGPDPELSQSLSIGASWNWHAGYHQAWLRQAGQHHFGAEPPLLAADQINAAILYLPKEKALADMVFVALAATLKSGTPLFIVGENRGGIKSIHKRMPEFLQTAQKIAVGHHCVLLASAIDAAQHFQLDDFIRWCELDQPGHVEPLRLASFPGVFAYPSIDAGSAMLLEHLPQWQQGRVLDFACGHGVLGAWLQRNSSALTVDYLDVSALALAATTRTLAAQQLTGTLIAQDGLAAEQGQYKYIVSHPPFHTGLATDYKIGAEFLKQSRQHLERGGELWLVANRFLPWPELLEQVFGRFERVAQDNKFAVYRAIHEVRR
ncbi:methyltransferase [Pseudidiomarina taiwanensis]|uniref:Ribosomal RNA small subunit methyltransferase C n=1 Tax=Pseudidiomarina taiwanensis TaxID=337250 RepID=A0A432ZKC0_9GAMM|nr:methyltransferase [Pseudidiomarina taiwanensis]RUO78475.1 16S rRNA methyltransferase [Pseudidiomarina taiwanensis]